MNRSILDHSKNEAVWAKTANRKEMLEEMYRDISEKLTKQSSDFMTMSRMLQKEKHESHSKEEKPKTGMIGFWV